MGRDILTFWIVFKQKAGTDMVSSRPENKSFIVYFDLSTI